MLIKNRRALTWTAVAALTVSCYHLDNVITVMVNAPTWTGAGHASTGNANSGRALGLAGEDIYVGSTASMILYDSPLLPALGPGYVLTGVAQTHTLGHHENTFMHAYPAGDPSSLDLFLATGFHFHSYTRIESTSPWFIKGSTIYEVKRICDMAAVPIPAWGLPTDDDTHLFLSVHACEYANPASCVGGIVEAEFFTSNEWGVKFTGTTYQAAIHTPAGTRFDAECMPISATGLGDTSIHYLAVGDPSRDELSLFRVGQLHSGPVSSRLLPRASQNIRDVVLEGHRLGTTDYGFLMVLWGGAGGTTLEHTLAVNGALSASPFLTEVVNASTTHIHSTGQGKPASGYGDVYTFGSSVVRRTYEQD